MAVVTAGLNEASDGLAAAATHMSTHSAAAGATGANETTGGGYARQPIVWGAAAGGIATLSGAEAFSGPASDPVAEIGLWTALSGGTFLGSIAPTGDAAFNAAGEYNVTTATITGTAA